MNPPSTRQVILDRIVELWTYIRSLEEVLKYYREDLPPSEPLNEISTAL